VKHRRYYKRENRKAFYRSQFLAQGGKCAICGVKDRLVIDHDHKSGLMRGLLCYKHNSGLGSFSDNLPLLKAAVDYLEHFEPHTGGVQTEVKTFLQAHDYLAKLINDLLDDPRFPSDRARARALAEETGLLEPTAQTKICRARKKRLTK
jgi:hypothetical protein